MWTKIRTLGELQVLTKASYLMLIFVPLLAGLWPAVRTGINRYNETVTASIDALESASQRLEFVASTVDSEIEVSSAVSQILLSLNESIEAIVHDYSLQVIEQTGLPSVWAMAFLASLSVTIGHLLYQAFGPGLVRRLTEREFENEELNQYVSSPSEGRRDRAQHYMKRWKPEESEAEINRVNRTVGPIAGQPIELEQNNTLIVVGSRAEYRLAASSNRIAGVVSGLFYIVGLVLIIWIMLTQTIAVLSAAWG
jgi:hypothetical protein